MTDIAIQSGGAILYAPGTSDVEIEAAARAAALQRKRTVIFWRCFILAVMLGAWEVTARTGIIDAFFYSYPSAIAERLYELVLEGTDEAPLWYHLWITMEEALIGFFFGSVFGIVFGVALGRNRMASDVLSVYIKVLNAIPRVVLAPIFILLFGFGLWSKVALSFIMVFFVVFSNAFQGVLEADRAMIANAQILGASPWQVTRSVIIPSAMSWIFASLHISFGFAIVGAIVGEFIGARYGIGFIIQTARGVHDTAEMYASIVIIVVVVLTAEYLMTLLEQRLARWRPAPVGDGHE
ncbi:ABC transporter permease [Microvirga puerhi]|uniref:ABC transporter permease n=1 Tax=Microvirga puerhi TaxID=2876078 RepID=A0ABS7VVA5_9HYPH|nr:ABC transporter permease [Microvirga puerhi]MBZ6079060.1 ABC transporter permease [Microvirga puerhi]